MAGRCASGLAGDHQQASRTPGRPVVVCAVVCCAFSLLLLQLSGVAGLALAS
jgi:hypothetical protein